MPATRAERLINGNGSGQIIFGDGQTNPVVNRIIHKTDEEEPQTLKNNGPNRVFSPVDENINIRK